MKKLLFPSIMLLLACNTDAQTKTDTLFPPSSSKSCFSKIITYSQKGYGYISGTSSVKDVELAQKYRSAKPVTITAVLARLYAPSKAGNGNISAKIWNVNYKTESPGLEIKESNPIKMSDVKNIGYTAFYFPSPVTINDPFKQGNSDFFVTIVLPTGAGDTLAVYSTEIGCYSNDSLAWVFNQYYTWASFDYVYNKQFTCDLIIFPVLNGVVGTDEYGFYNGIKLQQNHPNPFVNFTVIEYEMEQPANNVIMEIMDLTGKVVFSFNEGKKSAGKHSLKIEKENLPAGNYIFSLTADKKRLTKQMTVGK